MTLHWWMHWFWVTAQIVVTLTIPAITTTDQPTTADATTTSLPITITTTTAASSMVQRSMLDQTTTETLSKLQQSYRIAKAIGLQPSMNERSDSLRLLATTDSPRSLHIVSSEAPSSDRIRSTSNGTSNQTSSDSNATETRTTQAGRIPGKKEAKITWIQAFSKPPRPKNKTSSSTVSPYSSLPSSETPLPDEALTVMPLKEDLDRAKSLDPNAIRREQLPLPIANRSLIAGGREEVIEPHIAAGTVSSMIDVNTGDSTRLGRARGTFNQFAQEQQQQQQRGNDEETSRKESSESGTNVTEIATITGSCLAVVVLLSTVGSVGFIMYRRRYLNPPQTLNSDKCSNPDSSGYIDDSTIRDNSEEMYSLDNDSFLNSLEAMTIQNYWTDSVKHTKL